MAQRNGRELADAGFEPRVCLVIVHKPTSQDDDILVKFYAAGVNVADCRWLRGDPLVGRFMYGLLKPKNTILGANIAGRVEALGKNVTAFQPGDAVFGDLSAGRFGSFAEYVCARADALALKPANITLEQAAAVPLTPRPLPETRALVPVARPPHSPAARGKRRRSWALRATTMVLTDISTAPNAGESKMPQGASTPAASGSATTL